MCYFIRRTVPPRITSGRFNISYAINSWFDVQKSAKLLQVKVQLIVAVASARAVKQARHLTRILLSTHFISCLLSFNFHSDIAHVIAFVPNICCAYHCVLHTFQKVHRCRLSFGILATIRFYFWFLFRLFLCVDVLATDGLCPMPVCEISYSR